MISHKTNTIADFHSSTNSQTKPMPEATRLLDIVSGFHNLTISVIGDFILDEYVSGEISRVSREAPVLILKYRRAKCFPGGGANAVNNLIRLGARVLPVGTVGDDEAGLSLLKYFQNKNVDTSGILTIPGSRTTRKTRFLAGWSHTGERQVLRVDRDASSRLPEHFRAELADKAQQSARQAKYVLVSDYGLGTVTPSLVQGIQDRPVILDSRHSLLEYAGAGITAATPNEPEIESVYRITVGNDTHLLEQLGKRALTHLCLHALVVTRGRDGMALFEPGRPTRFIPAHGGREAVDVTGAGDTVIAVFTLALAASATYVEAAHLANYAGGLVVMKRRTATVGPGELEAVLRADKNHILTAHGTNTSETTSPSEQPRSQLGTRSEAQEERAL